MTTEASNRIKHMLATGAIDFSGDTFKICLSESELASGNGYTTGGNTLAGVTFDQTEITWDNTIQFTERRLLYE